MGKLGCPRGREWKSRRRNLGELADAVSNEIHRKKLKKERKKKNVTAVLKIIPNNSVPPNNQ